MMHSANLWEPLLIEFLMFVDHSTQNCTFLLYLITSVSCNSYDAQRKFMGTISLKITPFRWITRGVVTQDIAKKSLFNKNEKNRSKNLTITIKAGF